ncbi:DUF2478 domain-containing protein [Bradyrhizobium sp.]|uniref:DUF2478 domain-containing protein n=1 Tax=Bradyrhizobium sp. TaxID=376 RepID=UPI003C6898FC
MSLVPSLDPSFAEIDTCQIVALQGAPSAVIQTLLADIAARLTKRGLRVVGVVENSNDGPNPCKSMGLRSLHDDRVFSISQNLGPGSQACNLHPEGLALACAAVQDSIAHGADVAILSKFGKQEAIGGGLIDAFGAAIAAGVPIITSVSPAMMNEWRQFAGEFAECVTADKAQQDSWLERWPHHA